MNKKMTNLIVSILSLVMTTVLLIFTVYSWYTSNTEVKASSIIGGSDVEKANFELDYWDETEWKEVKKIEKRNVLPGTTTYFRLKCINTNSAAINITAKFEEIESSVDVNYVQVASDGKSVNYNQVRAYGVESGKVTVPAVTGYGSSKSILYEISGSNVTLKDFKVEEGYVIQRFGTTETKTGAVLNRDDIVSSMDIIAIDEEILDNQSVAVGTSYYYFALTFLDDDDIDNYYMYQELFIKSLSMFENK